MAEGFELIEASDHDDRGGDAFRRSANASSKSQDSEWFLERGENFGGLFAANPVRDLDRL